MLAEHDPDTHASEGPARMARIGDRDDRRTTTVRVHASKAVEILTHRLAGSVGDLREVKSAGPFTLEALLFSRAFSTRLRWSRTPQLSAFDQRPVSEKCM
jgi:hypothetical protein